MSNVEKLLDKYLRIDVFEAKFSPVEKIVYGLVGIILTAALLALLKLIFVP